MRTRLDKRFRIIRASRFKRKLQRGTPHIIGQPLISAMMQQRINQLRRANPYRIMQRRIANRILAIDIDPVV